jgi:hypothetical protein
MDALIVFISIIISIKNYVKVEENNNKFTLKYRYVLWIVKVKLKKKLIRKEVFEI